MIQIPQHTLNSLHPEYGGGPLIVVASIDGNNFALMRQLGQNAFVGTSLPDAVANTTHQGTNITWQEFSITYFLQAGIITYRVETISTFYHINRLSYFIYMLAQALGEMYTLADAS